MGTPPKPLPSALPTVEVIAAVQFNVRISGFTTQTFQAPQQQAYMSLVAAQSDGG